VVGRGSRSREGGGDVGQAQEKVGGGRGGGRGGWYRGTGKKCRRRGKKGFLQEPRLNMKQRVGMGASGNGEGGGCEEGKRGVECVAGEQGRLTSGTAFRKCV